MSFIIFDTEFTSWEGCLKNGWQGNQKKEIVQIAALKVSDDLTIIDKFNQFCRPEINPVLSDYFIKLTGITNEIITQNGLPFAKVFANFKKFVGKDVCFSHSWGTVLTDKADGNIIDENIELYHLSTVNDLAYYNIAAIFKQVYQKNNINITSQSSGQIAKLLNTENQLKCYGVDEHYALYDVYSILAGLKFLQKDVLPLIKNIIESITRI